jgi:hypothetical protein
MITVQRGPRRGQEKGRDMRAGIRNIIFYTIACLIVCTYPYHLRATDNLREIDERIRQLSQENAAGYLLPLLRSVAFNLNRSMYHTAEIKDGIDIYIGIKAMAAVIPTDDKTYSAVSPYDGSIVSTATIVGDQGAIVQGDQSPGEQNFQFPGGFRWNVIPIYVPQMHIGNVFGTQFVIRYLPTTKFDDKVGEIDVLGGGLQHSLSQYIPQFPLDVAVQGMYQSIKLGNILEGKGQSYNLIASKSFSGLTVYGGVGMETTDFSVRYEYDPLSLSGNPSVDSPAIMQNIQFDEVIEERFRGNLGISLRFIIFNLNADYTFGYYRVASIGLGIAI